MTCRELVELVTAYFDGALPDADRQRFGAHVALCPGCESYVRQMRQTILLAGELREEDVTSEAKEPLLAAFRDWKSSEAGPPPTE